MTDEQKLLIRSMRFKMIVYFLIMAVIGFVYGDIDTYMNGN